MSTFYIEDYENEFIDRLQAGGCSFEVAHVCILMYFKEISRPISEMPAILSRYSPKLTEEKIRHTFDTLLSEGLIKKEQYGQREVYRIVDDYEIKLEQYTKVKDLAQDLYEKKNLPTLLSSAKSRVVLAPKGVVSAKGNYTTLLARLQGANNSIKAAMLCSKVYEDTAAVFEEMANKGVHVQLLMGSNDIVKKVRGSSVNGTYHDWRKRLQNNPNIEVRKFTNSSAAELCSSYLIDDSTLRLVVFDYATMPSLDGYLLEVVQKSHTNINLVNWYRTRFDNEWHAARHSDIPGFVRAICSLFTLSIIATVGLLIYILHFKPDGILYDASFTLLGVCLSYIIRKSYKTIKKFFRKMTVVMKENDQ